MHKPRQISGWSSSSKQVRVVAEGWKHYSFSSTLITPLPVGENVDQPQLVKLNYNLSVEI